MSYENNFGRDNIMLFANGWAYTHTPVNAPPCTVTGWTYITFDKGGGYAQFSIGMPFGGGWNLHYHSMGDGTSATFGTAINTTFSVCGYGPWALNQWHHWAMRFNATNSRQYFYDGVLYPPADTVNQTLPFYIELGAGDRVPPHGLYGFLDDVRVYNRALSDAEIATIADPVARMQLYKFAGAPLSVGFYAH